MSDPKIKDAMRAILAKALVQLDSGADPLEVGYCFGVSLCRAVLVHKPNMASLVFSSIAVRGLSCSERKLGVWSVTRGAHDLTREIEAKLCAALLEAGVAKRRN